MKKPTAKQRALMQRMADGEQLICERNGRGFVMGDKKVNYWTVTGAMHRGLIVCLGFVNNNYGYDLTWQGRAALGEGM